MNNKGIARIHILVFVGLILLVGGVYLKMTTKADPIGEQSGELNENLLDCKDVNCFEEKFAKCEPASITIEMEFATIYYKILNPVTGGCKMMMKYTSNPNPDWQNKELICVFDNKLKLQESTDLTFNGVIEEKVVCEGSLYDVIKAL